MNRPLKVLLLNEFFYPDNQGGTGTATSDIAGRLTKTHGADVTVVTSRFAYRHPNDRYAPKDRWGTIDIHRVASPNWSREKPKKRFVGNLAFALASAWRAIWLPKPDVVLVTTAPLTLPIAARILKTFRGVPYAYLIYDLDPDRTVALDVEPETSKNVQLLRKWQSAWLKDSKRVIAIGRCMKDHLVRTYGLPPEQVAVVEVGADPDTVKRQGKETLFRKKNGIEGFVVMYSGNFGKYHDFDTILDAAEALLPIRNDVTFVLVGGGAKRDYVEEQAKARNLTNVRVFPFVPEEEFSDLLASADMTVVTLEPGMEGLCVPSKFYSFLSSGRPVIALMRAGTEVALVVEEANVGYRIDIGDSQKLVESIIQSASDPLTMEEKGQRARQIFDQLYTADCVAAKMYNNLVDCTQPGA